MAFVCPWLALGLSSSFYDLPWEKRSFGFCDFCWGREGPRDSGGEIVTPCFPGPSSLCQFKVYSRPPCHTLGYHVLRTGISKLLSSPGVQLAEDAGK